MVDERDPGAPKLPPVPDGFFWRVKVYTRDVKGIPARMKVELRHRRVVVGSSVLKSETCSANVMSIESTAQGIARSIEREERLRKERLKLIGDYRPQPKDNDK